MDAYLNFAYGLVATPPSPATSGNTLTLQAGHGLRLPAAPFNVAVWPFRAIPDPLNAEIARVTAIAGDVLTLQRAQESTIARTIVAGDQVAATFTKKMLDELVAPAQQGRYLLQIPHPNLPAAQALSALASGYLRVTGGTGVVQSLNPIPNADLPANLARLDAVNVFTGAAAVPQFVGNPALTFNQTAMPADQRVWQLAIHSTLGEVWLYPLNDDSSDAGNVYVRVTRTGNLILPGTIVERNRTVPLGEWTQVPYNAANFTANVGTWTVPSAGTAYGYTVIGKTLWLTFMVQSSTVAGAPYELRLALPAGLIGNASVTAPYLTYLDPVKGWGVGHVVYSGGTFVALRIDAGGNVNWGTGSAYVSGQLCLPLN